MEPVVYPRRVTLSQGTPALVVGWLDTVVAVGVEFCPAGLSHLGWTSAGLDVASCRYALRL